MAKADQVKALVRSHAAKDDARFYAVALQVAAHASRSGQSKFAEELKALIEQVRKSSEELIPRPVAPSPIALPRGELSGMLDVSYPTYRFSDMALEPAVLDRLNRVVSEQRQRARLLSFGVQPTRKLLLVGPPGTGKTMTAGALAGELRLPLFHIQLDGLITKFLGETASKLRLIFDAVEATRGVYLFDEFDALGSDRSSKNEVGEIRRVLNSFLQFLESYQSESVVIGVTNHPELLDSALFRRFDYMVKYELPDDIIIEEILRSKVASIDRNPRDWAEVAISARGLSHSDIVSACLSAIRDAILGSSTVITDEELIRELEARKTAYELRLGLIQS